MLIPKALRFLVPEEIRALLEKIDSINTLTDSSYLEILAYVRTAKLRRVERKFLRNALDRVERDETLAQAMHIVIYNKMDRPEIIGAAQVDLRQILTSRNANYVQRASL